MKSLFLIILTTLISPVVFASETATADYFAKTRHDPVALRNFLYRFPKGADLHNHLDGTVYAENYLAWAAQDGKCIDLQSHIVLPPPCNSETGRPPVSEIQYDSDVVNKIIDSFSVRNYQKRSVSGHNQFFSTFHRFLEASFGREGDMIAEAAARAARQNTLYLELMQSFGMGTARTIAQESGEFDPSARLTKLISHHAINELVQQVVKQTDRVENQMSKTLQCKSTKADPGCQVKVRYLAQVIRVFPRDQVLAQTILAFKLIDTDPRYVGLNFVAPEDHPVTLSDYRWQMEIIGKLAKLYPKAGKGISLHAGELALGLVPPEELGWHIREAIHIAGAKRIGHGIDIIYDPEYEELMRYMAKTRIPVEINLTSNDVILGIKNEHHPFNMYKKFNVPITLSTDDEGVSRIDLTHEYQRAVETYNLDYADIKQFSRNALLYSFLGGKDLSSLGCGEIFKGNLKPDTNCKKSIEKNEKAQMQLDLEKRFIQFEQQFKN